MLPTLVRDNIPQVITEEGNVPVTKLAELDDRKDWLLLKLQQYVDEFKQDNDPIRLVDMYEVMRALWAGYNPDAALSLSNTAATTRDELGGFTRFIILTNIQRK
jgi:predicted house-cleaning noncanonical NTP pyrophosphatase (MazG superfamily)